MHLDRKFGLSIEGVDLESLQNSADVVCLLDGAFRLRGYNDAWVQFAAVNDGADIIERFPIGCDLLAVIDPSLRAFYEDGYTSALHNDERFDCEYECSSPDVFRLFVQSAYPLPCQAGLLVTHHLRLEEPFPPDCGVCFGPRHVDKNGNIVQCSHCRKVRDNSQSEKWDWIPDLVRNPRPEISHSLCLYCLDFYYPSREEH